ncbi:MAG: hypothetical protein U9Q30_04860 [Campylobacterota bacterium]|nr:hypothetical protein [Campylobacterota bacterium]
MCFYKLVIIFFLFIQTSQSNDLFEKNCKNCHFQSHQLNVFMARYTLEYSSKRKIKQAIFEYLKNPKEENSIMPRGFLNRFGVKKETSLTDYELQRSIDKYYDIYNLKKRIK